MDQYLGPESEEPMQSPRALTADPNLESFVGEPVQNRGDGSWATQWEQMSKAHARPNHVPGWTAGDTGSLLYPPEYQKLAGPWIDGQPPKKG